MLDWDRCSYHFKFLLILQLLCFSEGVKLNTILFQLLYDLKSTIVTKDRILSAVSEAH